MVSFMVRECREKMMSRVASFPALAIEFGFASRVSCLPAVCDDHCSLLVGGCCGAFSVFAARVVVYSFAFAARARGVVVAGFWGHRGV
jgi:hypothetical protein